MSSLPPRIPPVLARRLPWKELYALFDIRRGVNELETALGLKQGTLAKAQREYPQSKQNQTRRGISAKVHLRLLEGIAERFQSSDQMRAWFKKHWATELLELSGGILTGLYDQPDLARQIPQAGIFPRDHISRSEEDEIVELLLNNKQVQVIWITGLPGVGKRTLALSLIRRHWERLKEKYAHVFWVDAAQGTYADGLRQIAAALEFGEISPNLIEAKIEQLARRKRLLIILDALHDVDGLFEWRRLVGYLGRLVVASRTRLAKNELMSDDQIHQVSLEGFSKEQGRKFMAGFCREKGKAVDDILEYTAGHPLALRILSGPMTELGLSAAAIHGLLERHALDALEYPMGLTVCASSLRACFDITYQALYEQHPEAAQYFQSAGVFHVRTIRRSLIEQMLNASTLEESKMTTSLLRFNLLNVMKLHGDGFVQLHPLLHEYAREKLNASNVRTDIHERYLGAIEKMEPSQPALAPDILEALRTLIERERFDRAAGLLGQSYAILEAEGCKGQVERLLREREGRDELRLLRSVLANREGSLVLERQDVIGAQERFELALRSGQGLHLEAELKAILMDEMALSLLGVSRCLVHKQEHRAAQTLLEEAYAREVFSSLINPQPQSERLFLLGEIHLELGDFRKALSCYQQAATDRALERQAHCHLNLGEAEEALALYTTLFSKAEFKAAAGLGLAASLLEVGRSAEVGDILDEIEGLLSEGRHWARLWQYRAFAAYQAGDFSFALSCAEKSLAYWLAVPDSEVGEKQVRELMERIGEGG